MTEIVQQYPAPVDPDQDAAKSMRINYADWGDVYKGDIAIGVISDFEVIQEDPFQVNSRVKVKIGGGEESEFIPLFYHPKAKYWDDEEKDILATDFDEINKFFKQAWMSFRCGDEAVVKLRPTEEGGELKPYAVIGFADGVPRIGENIIKINDGYGKMVPGEVYPSANGPDGLVLRIDQECEKIVLELYESYEELVGNFGGGGFCIVTHSEILPWGLGLYYRRCWLDWYGKNCFLYRRHSAVQRVLYLAPVGPLLYVIRMETGGGHTYRTETTITFLRSTVSSLENPYPLEDVPECYVIEEQPCNYPEYQDDDDATTHYLDDVFVALYNKENLEAARSGNLDNFVTCGFDFPEYEFPDAPKIYVRPHTKEELVDAGMWPYEVQ